MFRFHKRVTVEAECIICMDTERDCLLSPCCHLATCQVTTLAPSLASGNSAQACGELLRARRAACPICRDEILDIIKFYRS